MAVKQKMPSLEMKSPDAVFQTRKKFQHTKFKIIYYNFKEWNIDNYEARLFFFD